MGVGGRREAGRLRAPARGPGEILEAVAAAESGAHVSAFRQIRQHAAQLAQGQADHIQRAAADLGHRLEVRVLGRIRAGLVKRVASRDVGFHPASVNARI